MFIFHDSLLQKISILRLVIKSTINLLTLLAYLFQVKSQRTKLLSHPLVACLLRNKWKACGRYVYYSKLVVYMFYLIFLTGYSLYTVKDQYRLICARSNVTSSCHCVATGVPNSAASHIWIDFGKWIVVIISCFSLLLEVSDILFKLLSCYLSIVIWYC